MIDKLENPRLCQVAEVRAVVKMLPALAQYPSASRHSIRSRAWGGSLQGCSFQVRRFIWCQTPHLRLCFAMEVGTI